MHRFSVYFGLALGGIFFFLFKITSFFIDEATTYDLRTVDWDGIGAVMAGVGAVATFVAAWSAFVTSRAALSMAERAAKENAAMRVRRAIQAEFLIQNELDIALSRADAAAKLLEESPTISGLNKSLEQLRKVHLSEIARWLQEADLFDPLVALRFSVVVSADRKIKEIFGASDTDGKVFHPEAMSLFKSLLVNFQDETRLARDTLRNRYLAQVAPT